MEKFFESHITPEGLQHTDRVKFFATSYGYSAC